MEMGVAAGDGELVFVGVGRSVEEGAREGWLGEGLPGGTAVEHAVAIRPAMATRRMLEKLRSFIASPVTWSGSGA